MSKKPEVKPVYTPDTKGVGGRPPNRPSPSSKNGKGK